MEHSRNARTSLMPHRSLVLVSSLLLASTQDAQGYALVDLGAFHDFVSSARGINANGLVVGYERDALGFERAWVWENGTRVELPVLGGFEGRAFAINEARQIAGWAENESFDTRAVIWQANVPLDLGTLGGDDSRAFDINESGQVVGWASLTPGGIHHAFRYDGGGLVDLGALGGAYSRAEAINDAGVVVGSYDLGFDERAFVHDGLEASALDSTLNVSESWAYGIDPAGAIVGAISRAGLGCCVPTFWGLEGELSLPTNSTVNNRPFAINESGAIVGEGGGRALLWTETSVQDLNELLPVGSDWFLTEARDVNEFGQIVGIGTRAGEPHGFLLSPKPFLEVTDTAVPGSSLDVRLEGLEGQCYCLAVAPGTGEHAWPGWSVALGPSLSSLVVLASGELEAQGVLELVVPTTAQGSLVGEDVYWQAFTLDGSTIRSSNRQQTLFE